MGGGTRVVVLVEGLSDRAALETLALRRGRDLEAEGVRIVAMGGAMNVGRYVGRFGVDGVRLAALCDAAEQRYFQRALQPGIPGTAELRAEQSRAELADLGCYVCAADLEDELIRALGVAAVERVIADAGDLGPYRTFQKQPAQRSRTAEQRLRRFMGTRSGRKIEYARLLVERLELARVPAPLDGVLAYL